MDVSHDAASDEDVFDAAQVRVLELVEHDDVVEFDVQILVDGFEGAADGDVVLELHGHSLLGQGFEEARVGERGNGGGGGLGCTYLKKSIVRVRIRVLGWGWSERLRGGV